MKEIESGEWTRLKDLILINFWNNFGIGTEGELVVVQHLSPHELLRSPNAMVLSSDCMHRELKSMI